MTITREQIETDLVDRAKQRMELVGMTITTAGTNASLNGPISYAMRVMRLAVSSPVTDADLSLVPNESITELLDRAELRLLENILGNFTLTDITIGPKTERLDQIAAQMTKAIERKTAAINRQYGASAELALGTIYHDFQQKADEC